MTRHAAWREMQNAGDCVLAHEALNGRERERQRIHDMPQSSACGEGDGRCAARDCCYFCRVTMRRTVIHAVKSRDKLRVLPQCAANGSQPHFPPAIITSTLPLAKCNQHRPSRCRRSTAARRVKMMTPCTAQTPAVCPSIGVEHAPSAYLWHSFARLVPCRSCIRMKWTSPAGML